MVEALEMLHQFFSEGLSWSTGVALVLAFLKLREGRHKRRANEEMRNDIKAIKEGMGLWSASSSVAASQDTAMKRNVLSLLCWAVSTFVRRVGKLINWRSRMMNQQQINWVTLIATLLGAGKLILEPFGIHITDENVNEIANGVAALATVIGIIASHRKETATPVVQKKTEVIDYH